jgi:hypothetical protein
VIGQPDQAEKSVGLTLEERRSFLKLPLDERRRILVEQADRLSEYYDQEPEKAERLDWQAGDIVE